MSHWILNILIASSILLSTTNFNLFSQKLDSTKNKEQRLLKEASVKADRSEIAITVRSVNITKFPEVQILIEAYNKLGEPLDTLTTENLFVFENGVQKNVLKVERIPIAEKVPVDFVFLIDVTGSMQQKINQVTSNISRFTSNLMKRGIDYRIGLILFSDDLEKIYNPTKSVVEFLDWLTVVKAAGGGDEAENALEALEAAVDLKYRDEANKVAVLITDAPYHEVNSKGHGVTNQTTESIIEKLQANQIRVFSIVPPRLDKYQTISEATRGNFYDIDYPFSTILDNFSTQLTNLFALTYSSDETAVPDSIEIGLFNPEQKTLVKKIIPIVELGRKLIIENLLYETAKYELPEKVPELNILAEFMKSKPNIVILVEGHTDSMGSHALNDRLSLARAEQVKEHLVKRGISEHRIKTKGYGERRPIASNATDFGRQMNRRTEIVIVAK